VAKYYYQQGKPVGLEWESGRRHLPKTDDEANFLILAGFGVTVIIATIAYFKMKQEV
jgi:LPXTG-motif cell wall-anchored protein